jgi:phenylacetic acid degradation operon negative regulatory protein
MVAVALDLPRSQSGPSPQHLLTTLIGDYWLERPEQLPSVALVALLGEFDISLTGARAALARLARRGVLVSTKQGRNSYYGFAPSVVEVLAAGGYQIVSFGENHTAWDGRWTLAAFSLPEEQSELRYPLRSQLRWLGFAPLYDGLWVSPRSVAEKARGALAKLGLSELTVFRAAALPGTGRQPIDAWDLEELAGSYTAFVERWSPVRDQAHRGDIGAAAALVARTRVMDSWREFPNRDPDLPGELLPPRWPRGEARQVFIDVYDALGPLAAVRVRQIIDRYAPELATLVTHRVTAQLLATGRALLAEQP